MSDESSIDYPHYLRIPTDTCSRISLFMESEEEKKRERHDRVASCELVFVTMLRATWNSYRNIISKLARFHENALRYGHAFGADSGLRR